MYEIRLGIPHSVELRRVTELFAVPRVDEGIVGLKAFHGGTSKAEEKMVLRAILRKRRRPGSGNEMGGNGTKKQTSVLICPRKRLSQNS